MKTRIKALLRRRDGFTLVETITAAVLLVVLVGVCATLILTTMNGVAKSSVLMEQQSLGGSIYDYVSDCLRYGESLSLGDRSGPQTVAADDGYLQRRVDGNSLEPVYSADLYAGCALELSVRGDGDTAELSVTLVKDGETRYSQSGKVRLLNSTASGSGSSFSFT